MKFLGPNFAEKAALAAFNSFKGAIFEQDQFLRFKHFLSFPLNLVLRVIQHSHIAGEILLYTTTRRKIPNIWGNWHLKFNSPLLRLSCMMLNNGELKSALQIPHYGELNFYQFHTMGNWKFQMQYRNVNPSPRSKRDWPNSPLVTRGKPLATHGEFIFHHLWLRHYVVKNPIPFSPH